MRYYPILGAFALLFTAFAQAPDARAESTINNYGLAADVDFAKRLWTALRKHRWVGAERRMAAAQKGERPHGVVQQITKGELEVDGRTGRILVKANHRGSNATLASVMRHPNRYLSGYAVMYRREAGYDPANRDWFWVVFDRGGAVRTFESRAIAGRVDTGATNGCIGCHRKVGGRDLETLTKQ